MANLTDWTDFHAKFHQTLKKRLLLPARSRILVGVSGGQDSLCLLQLLVDLRDRWDWQLGIVHCNHGWRSDALANAEHVAGIAAQLELPIWVETATVPPPSEAAARQWRYQCFAAIATRQKFSVVVTGHTSTDRAETLLYNLVRGSGLDGLTALTERRSLSPQINLVRPLLGLRRSETEAFCTQRGLAIWLDSTNDDLSYARNRIRQAVLPYLSEHLNCQTEKHFAQTAVLLEADVAYLEAQTTLVYEQSIDPANPNHIDRTRLKVQPLALQRRVIRRFLQVNSGLAPNFEQIETVMGLITAPHRSQTSSLPGNAMVQVHQHQLRYCFAMFS
jgi:tRNA(Ile)-lysidine synthase